MSQQPHRVRFELPNGGGVVLEIVCALCRETPSTDTICCPICDRVFCAEACFEVHLNARDALDSNDAFDRFVMSPEAAPFREVIEEESEHKVDWQHTRDCPNCRPEMQAMLSALLVDAFRDAAQEEEEVA
jgi:hypothetical protein